MRKVIGLIGALVLLLSMVACGNSTTNSNSTTSISKEIETTISMVEVTQLTLPQATEKLKKAGFINISSNTESEPDWDVDRWIVVSQSIETGKKISPGIKIVLTCKKKCQLYLDLKSEYNLLFSKYDLGILVDGKEQGLISNGETFTRLIEVIEGDYEFVAYKSGDHSTKVTKNISVATDTTFKCVIAHGGYIEIKYLEIIKNTNGASLSAINVKGMILSEAKSQLKQIGFINIVGYSENDIILDEDNWIITQQSIEAGSSVDKNTEIKLVCIKLDKYFNDTYSGMTLTEVQNSANKAGFRLEFENADTNSDMKNEVALMKEEIKPYWVVKKARQYGGADKTAIVSLSYLGTPEEQANEQEKNDLLEKLEATLPKEIAKRAIVIAMTNRNALDVFTSDGNHYDTSKFHDYSYSGEYYQTITSEGNWSAKDANTWHVDNIYLLMVKYEHTSKISCNVTFDGTNYIISNLYMISGNSKYIDSNDTSKISIDEESPSELNSYLTVPVKLISKN